MQGVFQFMRFDRQKFWENYRKHFGPALQYQVDGLEHLLAMFERYWGWWDYLPQIANALAQVKIESAHSFLPVVEGFYLGKNKNAGAAYFQGDDERVRSFQRKLRYYPHFGRGHIQLTWDYNYAKHDKLVRHYFPELVAEFNRASGSVPFNLIAHPEHILDPDISFAVLTIGMHKGTFRAGHTLDRYIRPDRIDHFNAREIVNGDKRYRKDGGVVGELVKNYAVSFTQVLKACVARDEAPTEIRTDLPSPEVSPAAAPTPNPPTPGDSRGNPSLNSPPEPSRERACQQRELPSEDKTTGSPFFSLFRRLFR